MCTYPVTKEKERRRRKEKKKEMEVGVKLVYQTSLYLLDFFQTVSL